jgi:hypothetical protein
MLWAYEGRLDLTIDQSGFAICEVSSYPITHFFTFLESYEDFASFGGCFAQFQCVFADLWAFQGCPNFKHSFQDTNMILKFLRLVLMVWFVGYNMLRIIHALEEVRSIMCSSKCSVIFTYRCCKFLTLRIVDEQARLFSIIQSLV